MLDYPIMMHFQQNLFMALTLALHALKHRDSAQYMNVRTTNFALEAGRIEAERIYFTSIQNC